MIALRCYCHGSAIHGRHQDGHSHCVSRRQPPRHQKRFSQGYSRSLSHAGENVLGMCTHSIASPIRMSFCRPNLTMRAGTMRVGTSQVAPVVPYRSRTRLGPPRTSGIGLGERCAATAADGRETHNQRPGVATRDRLVWITLTQVWQNWARVGPGAAGHRRALASRLASPPPDPTFENPTDLCVSNMLILSLNLRFGNVA
jgi:hypothetical protein